MPKMLVNVDMNIVRPFVHTKLAANLRFGSDSPQSEFADELVQRIDACMAEDDGTHFSEDKTKLVTRMTFCWVLAELPASSH